MKPPGRRLISTGPPFERAAGHRRAVVDRPSCSAAAVTGHDPRGLVLPAMKIEIEVPACRP